MLEPVIQKNDLLSISITSPNPEATQVFNTPNILATQTSNVGGGQTQASGYLVNQEGFIEMPFLGTIKAAGLTKKALKEQIGQQLVHKELLLDPIVNIRYLNYKVTVLGEVANPSVISVPSEKITLLEALGLAGDLTVYAKRDNIMVIREVEGDKLVKRLNLNSSEIFTSPYYYLKSNDIVYVEPNKAKVASASNSRQWLPVVMSGLSLVIIAADRLFN